MTKDIPEDVPDITMKDPITKKELVVEGEHFEIAKNAKEKGIEPYVDSEGQILSDRQVAKLYEAYGDFPETYLDDPKFGEQTTFENKDAGLIVEKQWYGKDEKRNYLNRSYQKKYDGVIKRLRQEFANRGG
jgi:hypothetical protein